MAGPGTDGVMVGAINRPDLFGGTGKIKKRSLQRSVPPFCLAVVFGGERHDVSDPEAILAQLDLGDRNQFVCDFKIIWLGECDQFGHDRLKFTTAGNLLEENCSG